MFRSIFFTALAVMLWTASKTIAAPPPSTTPQDSLVLKQIIEETSEAEFRLALENYVLQLLGEYGEEKVSQEKFLVSLMQLLNREISRRLINPEKARQEYFNDLHNMLEEIQRLKSRLKSSRITDLNSFISELEGRIYFTIEEGDINIKKKRVFEDAMQLLYVAEEMIRLDREQQPEQVQLTQKISRSKEKLLTVFGEVPETTAGTGGKRPTIYDLFVEWKKADQVKINLRLADVKLARQNLLKASGLEEILRMFNEELKLAYQSFNLGDYDLADQLFEDIVNTYPGWGIKNLDDVYYYWAEANFALNRLLRAQELYQALMQEYPGTSFLAQIYSRLVQINYDLENYDRVIEYGTLYQNIAGSSDPDYGDIQFLVAMTHYRNGNYDRAVESLLNIPPNHPYYYFAQYFLGNAYTAAQLYDEATEVYSRLLNSKSTPPDLYARAAYKLGILRYEQQDYLGAIYYLNEIPLSFSQYDKVLNALSWAHFEFERSKTQGEPRDFLLAAYYAQKLVDDYYASPYTMEARGLLAYINQISNVPQKAIDLYRDVYQVKVKKEKVDEYISERARLEILYKKLNRMKELAFQKKNKPAYLKASRMLEDIENELYRLDISEVSSSGVAAYREVDTILSQIRELKALRRVAQEANNQKALKKIDSLRVRLVAVLESFPIQYIEKSQTVNWFDDYPVSKLIAEKTYRSQDLVKQRQEVLEEISQVQTYLQEVEANIAQAKLNGQYSLLIQLEQKRQQLQNIKKKYDQLLTVMYQTPVEGNPYPEFNRWADFGAFGIINVHFDQKQRMQQKLNQIAANLDLVNERINTRKKVIEDRIKKIEAEIRFMTMKARMEERARLRAERERAFRESYFDTRTSEVEEQ